MSFKKKEEQSLISKRFVSENELEEIKKKREEEWELARQQGRNIGETVIHIDICIFVRGYCNGIYGTFHLEYCFPKISIKCANWVNPIVNFILFLPYFQADNF